MKKYIIIITMIALTTMALHAQTIAEKKSGTTGRGGDLNEEMQKFLIEVNKELQEWHEQLHFLYSQVNELFNKNAPDDAYFELLLKINEVRSNIQILESTWREMVSQTPADEEAYALWHQPETTLGQLVIDYGSQDFVYLISPDIAEIQVSVNSNLPIPRSSWNEMLEQILVQNGVGIKQLNPFLKQLFLVSEDKSDLKLITNQRKDLDLFPPNARVSFVLSPEPSDVRRTWFFLDKFVNPNSTVLQMIGRDILIVGPVQELQELLKIYDFVSENTGDKDYKVVPLLRVEAEEMADILSTIFDHITEELQTVEQKGDTKRKEVKITGGESNGLRVVAMSKIAQALFLVGTKDEIRKAEEIIKEVENQVAGATQKVIFWYTAKHSDPEELAQVLTKVYALMVKEGAGREKKEGEEEETEPAMVSETMPPPLPPSPPTFPEPGVFYEQTYYQQGGYIINPRPIEAGVGYEQRDFNVGRNNFIVDPKTSTIVMVLDVVLLDRIKELIKKLDVPKKMVQLDVLFFEKRLNRDTSYGLNLLKVGSKASQTKESAICWNDTNASPENLGVTEFLLSRMKTSSGIPAFDIIYKFLISQDDIQINSAPSVVTLNQTTAIIAIKEEISINTGVFQVQTTGGVTLEDAFTRAQYGITVKITPTIHSRDEETFFEDPTDYVTLVSDITFDTIDETVLNNRPPVTRRNIVNEATVPDKQTVILGGLRNKRTNDSRDAIPFLGEIPCVGKLFSTTVLKDNSAEMFIFITPTIISDPVEDFKKVRMEELCKRPGDIPEFMCCMVQALDCERNRAFQGTLRMLFGKVPDRCITTSEGEYDGRCF